MIRPLPTMVLVAPVIGGDAIPNASEIIALENVSKRQGDRRYSGEGYRVVCQFSRPLNDGLEISAQPHSQEILWACHTLLFAGRS